MRLSQVALEWAIAIQLFRKNYQRRALSYFSFLIATYQWLTTYRLCLLRSLVSRKYLLAIIVNGTMGSSSWLTAVTATITNTTREGLRTYRLNLITFRFVKFFLTDRDSRLYLFFPVNFRIIEQSEFC
jgi:hypothetical protein